METCIVKNIDGFGAYSYVSTPPLNLALKVPDSTATKDNKYFLVNTGIEVSWNNYYGTPKWRIVEVRYKNTILFSKNDIRNVQVVIDILNKYNTISKIDLEKEFHLSQEKEKTELEIEIVELKAEKATLEEQIKIYKAIQTKKEEIKALLEKLS